MCTRSTPETPGREIHEAARVILVHINSRPKPSYRIDTKVPPETPGQGFEVHPSFRIDEAPAPLRAVLPMAFLFADVEVLRLTVHCVSKDKCCGFSLTEQILHCHSAEQQGIWMMALDQKTMAAPAALAHRTNCRICLSPTRTMYVLAHLMILTWR